MKTAFINGTIYTGDGEIQGKVLLCASGKIERFTDLSSIPEDYTIIDCNGKYIAPGLLDLQIYGAGEYLFSQVLSRSSLESISDAITATGTTGFLITLATNTPEVFRKAIEAAKGFNHPAFMGIHLEGPYMNPAKRGAHVLEYIRKPVMKEVEDLIRDSNGLIKMITLAPEMTDPAIISFLQENGVTVSAGHSNASYEESQQAFANGIRTATHLFNAMSPLHHREPGLPGALFGAKDVFASIVADGIHVAFPVISIAKKMMKERLFLITDAVTETLAGPYVHVEKEDRFTLPDGTLSGSKLTLLKAVENCVKDADIPLDEALRMASAYPAQVIGSPDRGKIREGYKADILVFDEDFKPDMVFINGEEQKR